MVPTYKVVDLVCFVRGAVTALEDAHYGVQEPHAVHLLHHDSLRDQDVFCEQEQSGNEARDLGCECFQARGRGLFHSLRKRHAETPFARYVHEAEKLFGLLERDPMASRSVQELVALILTDSTRGPIHMQRVYEDASGQVVPRNRIRLEQ